MTEIDPVQLERRLTELEAGQRNIILQQDKVIKKVEEMLVTINKGRYAVWTLMAVGAIFGWLTTQYQHWFGRL